MLKLITTGLQDENKLLMTREFSNGKEIKNKIVTLLNTKKG